MKKCKYCGKKTKDDDAFCSSCGASEFNYICANCGTEIEKGNFCPRCGLRVGTEEKFCRRCGTKYYTNACPNCGYTDYQPVSGNSVSYNYAPTSQAAPVQKKKHTLLWILGWLLFFPLPATVLIARSKKLNTIFKVILVVLVWLIYIGIANSHGSSNRTTGEESSVVSEKPTVTETKQCEHNYKTTTEVYGNCVEDGFIVKKCSKCGKEKTEPTNKQIGHQFVVSEKKTGTKGEIVWECRVCKKKVSVSLDNLTKSDNSNNGTSETITINTDELGTYGRIVSLHGEYSDGEKFTIDRYCYKLPAGEYTARTTNSKLCAFWIVKDQTTYEDDGVNEIFQYVGNQYSLTAGEDDYNGLAKSEVRFTVKDDESIMVTGPSGLLIVTAITENTGDEGTTSDKIINSIKSNMSKVNGFVHYDASYDEAVSTYLISSAASGSYDVAYAAKYKNDSKEWDDFAVAAKDVQDTLCSQINEIEPNSHIIYYCLNDIDLKYVLFIFADEKLVYSAVDTTVTKSINEAKPIIDEYQALKDKLKSSYNLKWIGHVSDDETGKCRLSMYSSDESPEKIALDYFTVYFENGDEIHALINTKMNVTGRITKLTDNILSVSILEHVENEEASAESLFGGELITEYWVYVDTGKIQELQ